VQLTGECKRTSIGRGVGAEEVVKDLVDAQADGSVDLRHRYQVTVLMQRLCPATAWTYEVSTKVPSTSNSTARTGGRFGGIRSSCWVSCWVSCWCRAPVLYPVVSPATTATRFGPHPRRARVWT